MHKILTVAVVLLLSLTISSGAQENFFDKFKESYSLVDLGLEGSPGEVAEISDFVYQKDAAEFTFESGSIHLLRFIEGRPTAAIFVGQGKVRIDVSSHLERQSLLAISGDSVVNQEFEVCFIRMSDNFDLKLKDKFTFADEHLSWRDYNTAAKGGAQGELFFKPTISHKYDNYFQLIRSVYERADDGYFWVDFNRYNFCYDPNRPEQVLVSYEYEGGDVVATEAAIFQRQENQIADDARMSEISYPTTPIGLSGKLEMGGLDGRAVSAGEGNLKVVVNADSLRFVSYFLHYNLDVDSAYNGSAPINFWRRKDFGFIGLILPQYSYKGDTLDITLWYHGNNYDSPFPYVEDPTPVYHTFDVTFPNGYNYIITDRSATTNVDDKLQACQVATQKPYHRLYLQGYASGYDTISVPTDIGVSINFLKSKHIKKSQSCFISDDRYREATVGAFNFYSSKVGAPSGTFVEYVYPEGFTLSAPGLIKLPQIACVSDGTMEAIGGFHALAGYSVARQWYGAGVQPVSQREYWLGLAIPEYMAMLYLESALEGSEFYSNLLFKRDSVYRISERGRDIPLACGLRETESISYKSVFANKGAWTLHMLRFLMFDTESGSDKSFTRFLYELIFTANSKRFSNNDFRLLAEKYYGADLSWFFDYWVYSAGVPEFKVEYKIDQRDGKYWVDADILTEKVPASFEMPVIFRVSGKGASSFHRERVVAGNSRVSMGPFDWEPEEMHFNEFFSVLSKDDVKKK
ncbi:MAG: hypothetical protein P1R58_09260 [bacterium]|nr:hypothetical protein [bacterium]